VRAGRLSRYSLVMAVVVTGIGFSAGGLDQAAASRSPAPPAVTRPPPRACNGATRIQGLTRNQTDTDIRVAQFGLGSLTSHWCNEPKDELRAHTADGFRAGDDSGDTELLTIYLLDNGDRVRFRALLRTDGTTDVGCSVELARPPRQDEVCEAEVVRTPINRVFERVEFSVLPVRR
jgi:hypothetical protein